jgi:hypothetical protein
MSIRNTPFTRDLILAVYSKFSSCCSPRETKDDSTGHARIAAEANQNEFPNNITAAGRSDQRTDTAG